MLEYLNLSIVTFVDSSLVNSEIEAFDYFRINKSSSYKQDSNYWVCYNGEFNYIIFEVL